MFLQILNFIFQKSGDPFLGFICFLVPIAIILVIGFGIINASKKAQIAKAAARTALQNAHQLYQDSLSNLKTDPNNPDLKQVTLQLGRTYSEHSRKFTGDATVTVYDELALMNDINAACAASTSNQISSQNNLNDIEARLVNLENLKRQGLIDAEEYNSKREKILNDV